jgi:murein DD-endopeptidase MepM/ murein hydrolase activator NlpD
VRNQDLDDVIFRALRGEKLKIFQSWDSDKKTTVIGGVEYDFVKVEFSGREENDQKTGWVAANFIEAQTDCKFIPQDQDETDHITDTQISGIDDEKCCEFPTVKQATHPYTSGMRRFRAGRGGGTRLHAAADIYRYKDEPILSIAPGQILRNKYYFYQGTYALEVLHSGGFIVRYGEITGMGPNEIKKDSQVKMGQRIGYMGVVNSGCCRPMLHFELYDGSKRGSLSQRGNSFQRRSDLINPTPYLLRWEDEKF